MRSPEHRTYVRRTGQNYDEISSKPGAFTVLPPDDNVYHDPPVAPEPYRLTPSARRHKNLSFSILAEPTSAPGSRSPSPTSGRVSPFRGRGFNPTGSRHASPAPSPPPPEISDFTQHSRIPRYSRRGSATAFGEKITDFQSSPNRRKLNAQLSQSLTNIAPKKLTNRPPQSPRRAPGKTYQRLSPIVGSSPEPSQSQSSPRISNNKLVSPNRSKSFVGVGRPPRPGSKAASRDPSPSKNPTSPTRIPTKSYRNVQAKVNSFSGPKPKVPPKPVISEDTTEDSDNLVNIKRRPLRKNSVNAKTNSKVNTNTKSTVKNINANNNNNNKSVIKDSNGNSNNKKFEKDTNGTNLSNKNSGSKTNLAKSSNTTKKEPQKIENKTTEKVAVTTKSTEEEVLKKSESGVKLSDILQPSTTTVVTTTTTTATQPLKIEAKIDSEKISPIVDGRVLSATSVSNAMNKMSDSVPNTQTLMKETGLSKMSPAATTIIAMSKEETKSTNPALDTRNATTALPQVEDVGNNINHGMVPSARILEQHVQNNMSKEHKIGNALPKSANERIIEARTVVAQPIKILVKERPMEVEVQSGNIRFENSNGVTERPGLPPPQQPTNDPPQEPQEPPKSNACTRFLTTCKKKMSCKKKPKEGNNKSQEDVNKSEHKEESTGCFNCRKKPKPEVTINIENDPNEPKKSCWDRIKCCNRNKVGDSTGCFASGKRKDSWVDSRRDSILSDASEKVGFCRRFWRRLFCLDRCSKKKPPKLQELQADSRRHSVMSKKKSLSSSVPVEEIKPKLDASLVEHTSQMKAAIPVLPVSLAWFCLIMNCIAPGTGTIFSGMFCLCIGKPRFSQKDGARPRIWAFVINLVIGFGQFFTVLFCLVGWGWSIWWGTIMLKLAKKNRRLKAIERQEQESMRPVPPAHVNHSSTRDPERGT